MEGNLGTGKTTFVKGAAEKFGINQIKSPTFLIIKKHPVENSKNYKKLVHIDAYRVPKKEIKKLNLKKILKNPENIVLIEWGSKLKDELPETALRVKLKHGNKKSGRIIKIINEN
ncbi:MAG: tRNA (adenosine(37)-N6)-threonylcarbamoyltransferase complex ATPase subunit type 1 TsaE [Candidatus Magasanikbacteria bacterium]